MSSNKIRFFLIRIVQVGVLTAIMVGVIFAGIPVDSTHYFMGSLQQVKLLEETNGPRIILVGGSNVAFGFNAELMQRELGIPVINDGLHAGLGIVPLRELQKYMKEGDIIIISLEYSMFSSEEVMNGDPAFLADWIEYSPSRIRYLSNPYTETLPIYVIMVQRKVNRSLENFLKNGIRDERRRIFNSMNFNANGDFIGHLNEPSEPVQKIPPSSYPVSSSQDEIFVFLESFYQSAQEKGANIYFEAPASRQMNCDSTGEDQLEKFFTMFSERSSIPLLTKPNQICMPNNLFFDTAYHLNAEGREIKTLRLIQNLIEVNPGIVKK